jgi:hypothetical protein
MRLLDQHELSHVAGGSSEVPLPPGDGGGDDGGSASKNNNGYGNGAESGPPPGNSGDHNPQLTGWNLGPRGVR